MHHNCVPRISRAKSHKLVQKIFSQLSVRSFTNDSHKLVVLLSSERLLVGGIFKLLYVTRHLLIVLWYSIFFCFVVVWLIFPLLIDTFWRQFEVFCSI